MRDSWGVADPVIDMRTEAVQLQLVTDTYNTVQF